MAVARTCFCRLRLCEAFCCAPLCAMCHARLCTIAAHHGSSSRKHNRDDCVLNLCGWLMFHADSGHSWACCPRFVAFHGECSCMRVCGHVRFSCELVLRRSRGAGQHLKMKGPGGDIAGKGVGNQARLGAGAAVVFKRLSVVKYRPLVGAVVSGRCSRTCDTSLICGSAAKQGIVRVRSARVRFVLHTRPPNSSRFSWACRVGSA